MKRTLLIGGMAVVLALVGSRAEADDFPLSPGGELCTTDVNSNLSGTQVMDFLNSQDCGQNVTDPFSLLYKSNTNGGEDGTFSSSYSSQFWGVPSNDLSEAIITNDGNLSMGCVTCYLVVKDGNNQPAQYFFSLAGWNGTDRIVLSDFWADSRGSISNVAIWGSATPVPEPATLLLLGTGLGLAALRQRRRRLA